MSLLDLIKDYNSNHKSELENRRIYLNSLSEDDFFKSVRDFGRVVYKGKSKLFSHFKNNRWYNTIQTTNDLKSVQLRDAFIEEIRKKNVLTDQNLTTFKHIFQSIEDIYTDLQKRGLKGANQMTKYDIACYIGFRKGLYPKDVYIHRGVINGAFALGLVRFRTKTAIIKLEKIIENIPALSELGEAMYVEDFLCRNKKQLREFRK
jgi:hypothetical protein